MKSTQHRPSRPVFLPSFLLPNCNLVAILGKALETDPNLRFRRGGERSQVTQLPWSRKKGELEESLGGNPPNQETGLYKNCLSSWQCCYVQSRNRSFPPRRKYWGHEGLLMFTRWTFRTNGLSNKPRWLPGDIPAQRQH